MSTYEVGMQANVSIQIDDALAPEDLFTRAETPEFQDHLYGDTVRDRDTVLGHWAYNAVRNGVRDPSRLDGWADMSHGVVLLDVTDASTDWVEDAS